jgi:hypothetical protein
MDFLLPLKAAKNQISKFALRGATPPSPCSQSYPHAAAHRAGGRGFCLFVMQRTPKAVAGVVPAVRVFGAWTHAIIARL